MPLQVINSRSFSSFSPKSFAAQLTQEKVAPYVFSINFVRLLLSLNFRNESSSATTELLQFKEKIGIVRRKVRLYGKISITSLFWDLRYKHEPMI